MNEQEKIAFGNLQVEVALLRELLHATWSRAFPDANQSMVAANAAQERARARFSEGGPEHKAIAHAFNTARPDRWFK